MDLMGIVDMIAVAVALIVLGVVSYHAGRTDEFLNTLQRGP